MTRTKAEQPKLLDVQRDPEVIEAEVYVDIADSIEAMKDKLLEQGEKVLAAMRKTGRNAFSFNAENGRKHTFTIVEGVVKLKHSSREDA